MSTTVEVIVGVLCFLYGLYSLFAIIYSFIFLPSKDEEGHFSPLTPARLYRNFGLNWFGAIVAYIACLVINPYWMIVSWFYMAFTCGHKEEE